MGIRTLTEKEEWVLRLLHHDFGWMTPEDAARTMGTTEDDVLDTIEMAEHKVPQMFPILEQSQRECVELSRRGTVRYTPALDCSIKEVF